MSMSEIKGQGAYCVERSIVVAVTDLVGGFCGFGQTPFCLKFTLKAQEMASPTFQILNFLGEHAPGAL